MQIRLTVVDPLGPPTALGRAASCDVLVTAPAGTALAAVASALAATAGGDGAAERSGRERGGGERGGREPGAGPVVLYAGAERLDTQRCTLGEPPLLDGAVLSLGASAEAEPHPELDEAPTQLHVVAGPDAGGVHLLHGGQITVGRSADADVPLDDPDVSRLHCAVTVAPDGRVSVADLGSTNGTVLDGRPIGGRPVRFAPGALLRMGESALRLTPAAGPSARVATAPDGEGQVRVAGSGGGASGASGAAGTPGASGASGAGGGAYARGAGGDGAGPGAGAATTAGTGSAPGLSVGGGAWTTAGGPGAPGTADAPRVTGTAGAWGAAGAAGPADGGEHGSAGPPALPAQGRAPRIESHGGDTHAGRFGAGAGIGADAFAEDPDRSAEDEGRGRKGTPLRGTEVPQGLRRRGGLGAWARRLTGGRGESAAVRGEVYDGTATPGHGDAPAPYAGPQLPETWPDPAALLLTALGPGPRLWERGPGHPEALTVRLGTADRPAPDGSGRLLPAVPVTAGLREVGALGLAGPRERLSGLARAVLAQLAALHSPETLEIVLISADRARTTAERTAEWSWLGWLPHVRPGHGQDCRLLLAHDREQAAARTDELLRRLDDHLADTRRTGQLPDADDGVGTDDGADADASDAERTARAGGWRPSWVRDEDAGGAADFTGPFTVVVVDGDPGGASVREAVARLAQEGPRAGIHVLCLAEAAPASPASPVTETYDAACAVSPVFRACGAVALLSGDVATALRLMRVARPGSEAPSGGAPHHRSDTAAVPHPREHRRTESAAGSPTPVSPGTVAVVDAVSPAWAERFARALAPLRAADATGGDRPARVRSGIARTIYQARQMVVHG
ncbi:FHA domain-containing protein, partial [Streptomyces seoulensis]